MGERAVFSIMAHVFQIDQETKRKWIPSSPNAVKVSYYHDPARKTYRIIAISESVKLIKFVLEDLTQPKQLERKNALINSTITASMNFTKTSPKFGQWSDHRANTVYGLGFSSEHELLQFIDLFTEAKQAARELIKERQLATQQLHEQLKPHPPEDSTPSPTSPSVIKSPSIISPPVSTSSTIKSPSPTLHSSAQSGPPGSLPVVVKTTHTGSDSETKEVGGEVKGQVKSSKVEVEEERPVVNGEEKHSLGLEPLKITNGHISIGDVEASPNGQLDSLKSENNGLKMALAASTTNIKKWESEIQTLKSNNAQLQTALEESKQHVSQWKIQLQNHKEENYSLKKKIHLLEELKMKESMQAEEMVTIKKENEELKDVLSTIQIALEMKTEEAQDHLRQWDYSKRDLSDAQANLRAMEEEKRNLSVQVSMLEDQLKIESMATQKKVDAVKIRHCELGHKLKEMLIMHSDLESHLNT